MHSGLGQEVHTQIMMKHLSQFKFMHHTPNIWQFRQSIPRQKFGGNALTQLLLLGAIYYIYMQSKTMNSMNYFSMSAIPYASGNFKLEHVHHVTEGNFLLSPLFTLCHLQCCHHSGNSFKTLICRTPIHVAISPHKPINSDMGICLPFFWYNK